MKDNNLLNYHFLIEKLERSIKEVLNNDTDMSYYTQKSLLTFTYKLEEKHKPLSGFNVFTRLY